MSAQIIQFVPFHQDRIQVVWDQDIPYVAVKPICERFGLAWQPQHRKLTDEKERFSVTIMVTETPAGPRETICVPAAKIFGWLTTIHTNKVAPEIRETLLTYQREADQVLFDHFMGRLVRRETEAAVRVQRLMGELLGSKRAWARIKAWADQGWSDEQILQQVSMPKWRARQVLGDMRVAGAIGPAVMATAPQGDLFAQPGHG